MINLQELAGKKFRIYFDPSLDHEDEKTEMEPWNMELRGKRGVVYPAGGQDLIAFADTHGAIQALKGLGLEVKQWGDAEAAFRFPASSLPEVAEILKLRTKRLLSDDHKAKLLAASAKHRFKGVGSGSDGQNPGRIPTTQGVVS